MPPYEGYVDAGHPDTSLSEDEDSSDTIEMTNLEDIVVTPNPHRQGYSTPFLNDAEDSDSDDGDEGARALLGSGERSRRKENAELPGVWRQVKGIVIEVRAFCW